MPQVASFEDFRNPCALTKRLEDREATRLGTIAGARDAIARGTGISASSLEHMRRGRAKDVKPSIHKRLLAYAAKLLNDEMTRLAHEIEMVHLCNPDSSSDALNEVALAVEKARGLLAEYFDGQAGRAL